MNDETTHDDDPIEEPDDAGTIGVGMGGSCPNCRAPIDLGQEFCLECGSPIRFTPRQRGSSSSTRTATTDRRKAPPGPPPRGGFPWVPFLVVLVLIAVAVAVLLSSGDDSGSDKDRTDSTESALSEVTNSTPSTAATVTLQDCIDPAASTSTSTDADPSDGFAPSGTPTAAPTTPSTPSAQFPQDSTDAGTDTSGFDTTTPSTTPETTASTPAGAGTVTVDQNGNPCPATPTTPTAPTSPTASTAPTTPTTPGSTTSGDWPAGQDGWTVVVAGYPTNLANAQQSAQQRAADVTEDGFTDGGVLDSGDFPTLCPGFYVVFSGVFDSKSLAERRLTELRAKGGYADLYTREVKRSGTPASNCRATN